MRDATFNITLNRALASIAAFEPLYATAVADFGRVDGAFGIDRHAVHPLEIASHVARPSEAILAASSVGITTRLAGPLRREFGKISSRIRVERAASACISPSTSSFGCHNVRISSTSRILRAEGVSSVPKLECDNSATFGFMPKRRTSSA